MNLRLTTLAVLSATSLALSANAATEQSRTSETFQSVGKVETIQENIERPVGLWIFGGLDSGAGGLLENGTGQLFSESGFQISGKGLMSFYLDDMVFDLGAGYQFTRLNGNGSATSTRAGLGEVAGRYRLSDRWQLGVATNILFGPNVSFRAASPYKGVTGLVGPNALYDMPLGKKNQWHFRVGAKILTDVNLPSRQLVSGIIDIQVGFPVSKQSTSTRTIRTAYEPVRTNIDRVMISDTPVNIRLRDKEVRFSTGNHQLNKVSRTFIRRLGNYLVRNKDSWSKIQINGHTDIRGNLGMNQRLSENRAKTVYRELVLGGINAKELDYRGFGPSEPLDTANNRSAWAKNRRVELLFYGVPDSEKLRNDIEKIQIDTLWN